MLLFPLPAAVRSVLTSSVLVVAFWPATPAQAERIDIYGPADSVNFGASVTVLPNGNFVVTDPLAFVDGQLGAGAVHLIAPDGTLISTLTGSQAGDHVGNGSITVVGSDFVIRSTDWNNGAAAGAGAATWVDGTKGLTGVVSASNSLVGTSSGDHVGSRGVTVLAAGNYVVTSPLWNNGAASKAGAATWGSGSGGVAGPVSIANSLVGTSSNDYVANYGVVALSNGHYVVRSPDWNNGSAQGAGAATWGNGGSGVVGAVSSANSLVGSTAGDQVGADELIALPNGNYVVASSSWDNGATPSVGAVTWAHGSTGIAGAVSASNSFIGATANDQVGIGVTGLGNNHYVVTSPYWSHAGVTAVGAVTWGDGDTATVGTPSTSNSMVGAAADDQVGIYGAIALTNGNYVVRSPFWDDAAVADAGAATWCAGAGPCVGIVSSGNSLVGTSANDNVGLSIWPLDNGNYVVSSPRWSNGGATSAGAATWGSGSSGIVGPVSAANSLVGATVDDSVGETIVALRNGHYVVGSYGWNDGAASGVGAVTWGNGNGGTVGVVNAANSLVGTVADDHVGYGIFALRNGNYVVSSSVWDDGPTADVGAITWCNGETGLTGRVSAANSLVGSTAFDHLGNMIITALSDGNYAFANTEWHDATNEAVGAVTLVNGAFRMTGTIDPSNSIEGIDEGLGATMKYAYDAARHRLVVGVPAESYVSLFTLDQIFAGGFEP